MQQVRSDEAIRKAALKFFDEAQKARNASPPPSDALFGERHSQKGGSFYFGPELAKCLSATIELCTKRLGNNLVNERDVEELLWDVADLGVIGAQAFKDFCDRLHYEIEKLNYLIIRNNQIRFEEGITELRIGPVRAILGSALAEEINSTRQGDSWKVHVEETGKQQADHKLLLLPIICWHVKIKTTRSNTKNEAVWLANVALSLLRVELLGSAGASNMPTYGQVEPTIGANSDADSRRYFVQTETGMRRVWEAPSRPYVITRDLLNGLNCAVFEEKATLIFNAPKKSIAVRVFQGLGWLTRARQSREAPEKFLYFFTALETLLTRDLNAPVTETISRHVSVILTDDHKRRAEIASTVKNLYGIRSKLVHVGQRDVSPTDTKELQRIAESVYHSAAKRVVMDTSVEKFQGDLVEAGYGLSWPSVHSK